MESNVTKILHFYKILRFKKNTKNANISFILEVVAVKRTFYTALLEIFSLQHLYCRNVGFSDDCYNAFNRVARFLIH